ncbi:MAG: helix-turn-helix domain-containing protein, partial [Chloroflexota bacterium]
MGAETALSVGALLKEYRLSAGLTQEGLAERAGIGVRSVQAIESGANKPHSETARRLADALGLGADERALLTTLATLTPRRRAPTGPASVIAFPTSVTNAAGKPGQPPPYHFSASEARPDHVLAATPPRNPYKGLRAFRAADAGDFFGRETLIAELAASMHAFTQPDAARFLTVVGPSGSGKSSVVLAGLLPHLRRGALPGSTDWVYLDPLLPGAHPLESLSLAVAKALPSSSLTAIRADLDASERGLHLVAARVAGQVGTPESRVLLIVDQAEELFTLTADEEERRQVI